MEYRQIVAITGLPGLFQLLNAKKTGAVVKSLKDNSVSFVSARKHQLTPIESIEIYTTDENVPLSEVFTRLKEHEAEVVEANEKKDKTVYKTLFKAVLPNYDEDRVYASDIKKVFRWFPLLKANDLLNFESKENEEEEKPSETAGGTTVAKSDASDEK